MPLLQERCTLKAHFIPVLKTWLQSAAHGCLVFAAKEELHITLSPYQQHSAGHHKAVAQILIACQAGSNGRSPLRRFVHVLPKSAKLELRKALGCKDASAGDKAYKLQADIMRCFTQVVLIPQVWTTKVLLPCCKMTCTPCRPGVVSALSACKAYASSCLLPFMVAHTYIECAV